MQDGEQMRQKSVRHVHLDLTGPVFPEALVASYESTPCVLHFQQLHSKNTQTSQDGGEECEWPSFMVVKDLPWLHTGEGRLRAYSAVPDAWAMDVVDTYPTLARTTMYSADLGTGECLLVPAGWFFQLKSSSCHFVQHRATPNPTARFRPTLMHKRAAQGDYCAMLKEKGSEMQLQQSNSSPHRKRKRPDNHTCTSEEETPSSPSANGNTRRRRCRWREQGWSSKLDLSCDWFSHNIASWERTFASLGWLAAAPCCKNEVSSDTLNLRTSNTAADSTPIDDMAAPLGNVADTSSGGRLVLEIGVWEGNSAAWLLQHVVGGGTLLCVDSFQGGEEHQGKGDDLGQVEARFRRNMQRALQAMQPTAATVLLLKGETSRVLPSLLAGAGSWERLRGGEGVWETVAARDALRDLQPLPVHHAAAETGAGGAGRLDAVYVDASHRAEDVLLDAVLAWSALRAGGLLIFDDYQWHAQACPHYDRGFGGALHQRERTAGSPCGEEGGEWTGEEHLRSPHCHCPGRAVDAFMRVHGRELEVLHAGYQVVARKQGAASQCCMQD